MKWNRPSSCVFFLLFESQHTKTRADVKSLLPQAHCSCYLPLPPPCRPKRAAQTSGSGWENMEPPREGRGPAREKGAADQNTPVAPHPRSVILARVAEQAGPGLTGTLHQPPAPSSNSGLREASLLCGRNLINGERGGEGEREGGLLTAFSTFRSLGRFLR